MPALFSAWPRSRTPATCTWTPTAASSPAWSSSVPPAVICSASMPARPARSSRASSSHSSWFPVRGRRSWDWSTIRTTRSWSPSTPESPTAVSMGPPNWHRTRSAGAWGPGKACFWTSLISSASRARIHATAGSKWRPAIRPSTAFSATESRPSVLWQRSPRTSPKPAPSSPTLRRRVASIRDWRSSIPPPSAPTCGSWHSPRRATCSDAAIRWCDRNSGSANWSRS